MCLNLTVWRYFKGIFCSNSVIKSVQLGDWLRPPQDTPPAQLPVSCPSLLLSLAHTVKGSLMQVGLLLRFCFFTDVFSV